MKKLTITINGKEIEMKKIKARHWREVMKFEDEREEFSNIEAVDKYCEVIATVFGVTPEEVADNLDLEDVVPLYFEVLNTVAEILASKITKKNTEETENN